MTVGAFLPEASTARGTGKESTMEINGSYTIFSSSRWRQRSCLTFQRLAHCREKVVRWTSPRAGNHSG